MQLYEEFFMECIDKMHQDNMIMKSCEGIIQIALV